MLAAPVLLRMMFVRELEVDVSVLSPEGIVQPVHHVGDLGPVDVVALVREAPGEGQEPETGELLEDVNHLGQIHLAAPDGERHRQPLQHLQAGQFSDLLWSQPGVAQHGLRLNLQQKYFRSGKIFQHQKYFELYLNISRLIFLTSSSNKCGM